ncbi:hypothetical protein ACOMHN_006544 [Nucella lapillus]
MSIVDFVVFGVLLCTALTYHPAEGGHRPRGWPKLRYKDTLKKSLQKCDIDEKRWEFLATNRETCLDPLEDWWDVLEETNQQLDPDDVMTKVTSCTARCSETQVHRTSIQHKKDWPQYRTLRHAVPKRRTV